jgi:hypothetical protein
MGNDLLEDDPQTLAPGLSKARKYAIEYFFRHHYGAAQRTRGKSLTARRSCRPSS